jgi:hypothetical protein
MVELTSIRIRVLLLLEILNMVKVMPLLFIPCIFVQPTHPLTNALIKIQFMTIIKTPKCFSTEVLRELQNSHDVNRTYTT